MTDLGPAIVWCAVIGLGWTHRPRTTRPLPAAPTAVAAGRGRPRVLRATVGFLALVAVLATEFLVAAALGIAVVVAAVPRIAARRSEAADHAAEIVELPEAIELTRLALSSTGSTVLAVGAVGDALQGPVGVALRVAAESVADRRLADALVAEAAELGPGARRFLRTLAGGERYGVAVGAVLEQLAAEARRERRRHAEAAARRVPVRLLLPLVGCILPAFVLLTLVPVLLRTLLSLDVGS